jgi:AraC-like DNA-binding protein
MSNKTISWAAALRDLKSDRAPRAEVREERLKTTAGLRGTPALPLSAWRGRSGFRYIVGVHPTAGFSDDTAVPCVMLAVRRNADGIAERLLVSEIADDATLCTFAMLAEQVGASELHVHRLCGSDAERAAMIQDLRLDADQALVTAAHARGQAVAADLYGAR